MGVAGIKWDFHSLPVQQIGGSLPISNKVTGETDQVAAIPDRIQTIYKDQER